ncbi:MAG: VOC family protein [Bacillota bacterium]|nr:VOC family protein [Bacillota bacterium]
MRIEHIAVWTNDIERLAKFYEKYFDGKRNEKYINESKGFESYFLIFEGATRLEIMSKKDLSIISANSSIVGLAHIAFSVGSEQKVIELTDKLINDGYKLFSKPRITGDGYFESAVMDPDGNIVEITK